jgi:hypothetical protein
MISYHIAFVNLTIQVAEQSNHDKYDIFGGFDGRNPDLVYRSKVINYSIHKIDQSHVRVTPQFKKIIFCII